MKGQATQKLENQPAGKALRFDVVAGLTAAAVVLPKAMALDGDCQDKANYRSWRGRAGNRASFRRTAICGLELDRRAGVVRGRLSSIG